MSTLERLQTILLRDYPLERSALTPDALLENLGVDSLGVMDLLFAIEEEFHVAVPPERVPLATLGDLVAYVDALVAARADADPAARTPH